MKQIIGNIVDITSREIFFGRVEVEAGEIRSIVKIAQEDHAPNVGYIIPGFVDSHIHIESSMLTPQRFGEMVIGRGTIATVSDPHEIANVMGERGIRFMLSSAELSPVKIHFTIPSSVPATPFDSSGAVISGRDVEQMAASGHFVALSEMMDVPAVLNQAEEVVKKLSAAKRYGLPIDGHAPLLRGEELSKYVESGISTDHEEYTLDTAREKIAQGMSILIREGSAARNFEALKPLIEESPDQVMFCFDDAHPDDILERGHIDSMVRRAI
ncbi:MAG: amidohydrolase family protein, partial [Rikenellaceae bacterium]